MATNGRIEPNSHYPSIADAGNSIIQHGFKITTRKLPILKAEPIEQMTKNLGIAPPEMIFGDNLVSIDHESGWGIQFNTYDALDRVDKTGGSMLQVAHSREWQSTREKKHEGITEVVKPFDWSYSTDYKGTLRSLSPPFEITMTPIPLELLKRPDPILFFDEVVLYEDEMADNGITMYSCKIRVMPARLLLLCRFFMRLDNVLLRIRDTRVYVEFGTGEVTREYVAKEEKYEVVRQKLASRGQDVPAQLRDPNNINDLLPIVNKSLERLMVRSNAKPRLEARRQTFPDLKDRSHDGNHSRIVRNPNSLRVLQPKSKIALMASITVCAACRQVLRRQSRQLGQSREFKGARTPSSSIHHTPRLFTTGRLLSASQATPRPYQSKPPPVNPGAGEGSNGVSSEGREVGPQSTAAPGLSIAKELHKRVSSVTETYVAYGVCENLVKECARQAGYTIPQAHEQNVEIPKTKDGEDLGVGTGWWFETLGLTPTFNTWAQITFLHMYVLTCRLRCFPPTHAPVWHQHLLDHFFYMAEDRMVTIHNIAARSIRNKYLKDLFVQWRGLTAGYDEGIVRGDAVLATAVWRNIFKADENVDFRGVGEVVSYIRGVLKGLDGLSDESVAGGEVVFGDPESERDGVLVKSRMMIDSVGEVTMKEPAKAAQ